jgi:hypothetical protein
MIETLADAETALGESLGAAAARFEGQLGRLLLAALSALDKDRPRLLAGEITLTPGTGTYPAPAGLVALSIHEWGMNDRARQWDADYAGPPPRVLVHHDGPTAWILFRPAPTARQVMVWGSVFRFRYRARHVLDESTSTLRPEDAPLLILRAKAEAMQDLAASGVVQPIQTHKGMGASLPANGTPAALAKDFLDEYRRRLHAG